MRNVKTVLAVVILLALPSFAGAVTLANLAGTADCNSWSADLTIDFRANALMARVEYAVVLQDASGIEVERFDFADFINMPGTPSATFTYGADWTTVLDSDYTVAADFTVFDIFGDGYNTTTGSFAVSVACGPAGGDDDPIVSAPCHFTARHWAANPADWPADNLSIGGQDMDQVGLLKALTMRNSRGANGLLVRELIAAKLNLANGGSDTITAAADQADVLLAQRGSSRRLAARNMRQIMTVRRQLLMYNRSGCPDSPEAAVSMAFSDDADISVQKAAVEFMSMGTVKALYR